MRLRASSLDFGLEVVGVVPLVGNHGLSRQVLDQLVGVVDVGNLSGRQNHPQTAAFPDYKDAASFTRSRVQSDWLKRAGMMGEQHETRSSESVSYRFRERVPE